MNRNERKAVKEEILDALMSKRDVHHADIVHATINAVDAVLAEFDLQALSQSQRHVVITGVITAIEYATSEHNERGT